MKKKYRVIKPMTAYVLGTLVCFSRFCRAGYLDSCVAMGQSAVVRISARGQMQLRLDGRDALVTTDTYLLVELAKVVLDLILGRSHYC